MSFDQRFPLLMAYKECILDDPDRFESCENKTYDSYYSFAHFDEASTSWTPIVSQRRYTGIAKLIPSYSFNPTIRVLDTLAATHRFRPQYRQDVFFYREASAADDHQVMVALPRATCPPIENKGEYSEETADLWQPVKFVVVVGGRATIFVELNREKADCAGLRVQDVLGDTAGIPADLAARAYRVYTADVAQAPGGKVLADLVKAPLCTVETGVADDKRLFSCPNPAGKLTVELDPIRNISLEVGTLEYVCHIRTSSMDWNLYGGMAAKVPGEVSYSRRCALVKR